MNYFVECHLERIDEYRRFANDMLQFLQAKGSASPELKPFLERLEQTVRKSRRNTTRRRKTCSRLKYAADLTRQDDGPHLEQQPKQSDHLRAVAQGMEEKWAARRIPVVAQCHVITRSLFQEAGYGCVNEPKAVAWQTKSGRAASRCSGILMAMRSGPNY
jgi:hypothetical protein